MPVLAVGLPGHAPSGMLSGSTLIDVIDAIRVAGPETDVVLLAHDLDGLRIAWSARLAFGEDRVGVVYRPMTPTVFYAVAAVCQRLPQEVMSLAGVAATSTLNVISTQILLSSVASLEQPTASVGQHLMSLWPGTRFVVDRDAGVVRRAKELSRPDGVELVIAGSVKAFGQVDTSDWPQSRIAIPAIADSTVWRASRWLEVSALKQSIESIINGVLHPHVMTQYLTCSDCGRLGWGARCIFCELRFPTLVGQHAPELATGGFV